MSIVLGPPSRKRKITDLAFASRPLAATASNSKSRGSVRLKSADSAEPPSIRLNYLSTVEDQQVAVDSLRQVRRIVSMPALRKYHPQEFKPGAQLTTDDELLTGARERRSSTRPEQPRWGSRTTRWR